MNKLYLECYSGISGDMTVAALLDLGADENILRESLKSLNLPGFNIEITRVKKSGIDACDFNVILDKEYENHDHDMNYLHGKANQSLEGFEEHHNHNINEENVQSFEENLNFQKNHVHNVEESDNSNVKNHSEHMHEHTHRKLNEILEIIDKSKITQNAKNIAKKIFTIIGQAEAKAHKMPLEEVHFHEVGAVDTIVDIVSVAVCLDNLNITEVVVSTLYEGRGFIRCEHGVMSVPVPAVLNIVCDNNLNLHITEHEGEFVTPTGAAIVAAIKTTDKLPDNFKIKKIGIGAGKRKYEIPSLLRAMIIEDECENKDCIYKLESNIDDSTGEALGFVMDRLLNSGARDVNYSPVYMKKNRPAYLLNVLCKEEDIATLEKIIFEDTTTIGIRKVKMDRVILDREIKDIETSLGKVKVKVCKVDETKRCYPEYQSIADICREKNMNYQDVYRIIISELYK